jgi:hypothetical protein
MMIDDDSNNIYSAASGLRKNGPISSKFRPNIVKVIGDRRVLDWFLDLLHIFTARD